MLKQTLATVPLYLVVHLHAPVHSAPFSERHAFCVDRTSYLYEVSVYRVQKAYNSCMKRAEELIREHEAYLKQSQIESQNRMKREREAERIRQQEVDAEFNDVFGEFKILQID